jgi:hypothetical protein
MSQRQIEWTGEILQLLGKIPDRELSQRFGIARATVAKKRSRLGIPAARRGLPRTRRVIQLLSLPTREAARRLDLSPAQIAALRKQWSLPTPSRTEWRWTRKILARLGQEPDTRIARDTGIGFRTVRAKRESLGIAPFRVWQPWRPEEEALLGTCPDQEIAEQLGRSWKAVEFRRHQLGIRFRQRGAEDD